MRWYHWLLVPFVVSLAVVAFVFGRRRGDLVSVVTSEIDAVDAKATAKKLKAREGSARSRRASVHRALVSA